MTTKRKNYWRSWLIYITLFFVVMLGANWWKTRDAPTGNLSELSGQLMDGTVFSIAAFSGKPVILHFWATWCPICDLENSSIQSIAEDYTVITVASWSEDKTNVEHYMQENQLTFPVMLDNNGKLAKRFGLSGVPVSFIIDAKGNIQFVETGYSTEMGLRLRLWLAVQ